VPCCVAHSQSRHNKSACGGKSFAESRCKLRGSLLRQRASAAQYEQSIDTLLESVRVAARRNEPSADGLNPRFLSSVRGDSYSASWLKYVGQTLLAAVADLVEVLGHRADRPLPQKRLGSISAGPHEQKRVRFEHGSERHLRADGRCFRQASGTLPPCWEPPRASSLFQTQTRRNSRRQTCLFIFIYFRLRNGRNPAKTLGNC
jgi:hypothetical protein